MRMAAMLIIWILYVMLRNLEAGDGLHYDSIYKQNYTKFKKYSYSSSHQVLKSNWFTCILAFKVMQLGLYYYSAGDSYVSL